VRALGLQAGAFGEQPGMQKRKCLPELFEQKMVAAQFFGQSWVGVLRQPNPRPFAYTDDFGEHLRHLLGGQ